MRITRIYADEHGGSRFGELEIALYDYDWHPAPRRQFIVLLDGEIEIEVSSGEPRKRIFHGGDVLLMEDTAGRGHRTRNIQPRERRSVFIVLADQAQNT